MKPDAKNRLLIALAASCAVVLGGLPVFIRAFVLQPFRIPTATMAPTLLGNRELPDGRKVSGDRVFVDKWSYRFRKPERGEIVVFRTDALRDIPESSRGKYYVKRIVGLPGETVSIKPPFVCVNGQPVAEPPVMARIERREGGFSGYVLPNAFSTYLARESNAVKLGSGEYFVLGDNSPSSMDSRFWGPLPPSSIVGRVVAIYYPFDRARMITLE